MRNPDRTLVRGTVLSASMLVVFGGAVFAPTLPAIAEQFREMPNIELTVQLVLTIPSLLIAINSPIAGYLVDNVGRKRVLVASALLTGLAGLSGYIAPTLTAVLIGRAFLGLAVAGVMTSTSTLIADYWYGPERSRMMGLQAGALGIAATIFMPIIGVLADVGWRSAFLVHLLAFAVLPFILVAIYEPRLQERCLEKPPAAGEPGACVGQSIEEGKSELPPAEPEDTPVRMIAFIYGIVVLIEIVFFVIPLQLPFHLRDLLGASATESGLTMALAPLSFAISSIFYGRFGAKLDHLVALMIGLVITGLGYTLVTVGSLALYLGLILAGIGLGQLIPNLYTWLANEAPVHLRGRILGGFTTAIFLGQFLSPIVSQPVTAVVKLTNIFLVAGVALIALVPIVYLTRNQIRLLSAHPA